MTRHLSPQQKNVFGFNLMAVGVKGVGGYFFQGPLSLLDFEERVGIILLQQN